MKGFILLIFAVSTVCAYAQHGHGVSKNAKHVIACPVTGDKVDMDKATKKKMFADYKGNRYFFCCNSCPPAFNKNPSKYANQPHVKAPKK